MRRSNFALRLQPSLLEELRKAAELEGVAQTRSSMWQWRKRFPPCVPKIRFAWFPVWLRNKEDFRAVAMRNIEHIYDVRHATQSSPSTYTFHSRSPLSSCFRTLPSSRARTKTARSDRSLRTQSRCRQGKV